MTRAVVNQNFLTNASVAPWREQAIRHGYQSSIALPLKAESGATFAILNVYASEPDAFDAAEASQLAELAETLSFGHTAIVGRQQRFEVMARSVEALAATVESRDPYTAGHLKRVADLSLAIATEMGIDAETCVGIRLAALVHDIGKIHVPIEFLTTPKPLSVAEMVRQHHEFWDGGGYPRGLRGVAITPGARILAVADVVEAIHSHRPYRPAKGLDAALAEISTQRGTQFDPDVVDACLRLFRERRYPMEERIPDK